MATTLFTRSLVIKFQVYDSLLLLFHCLLFLLRSASLFHSFIQLFCSRLCNRFLLLLDGCLHCLCNWFLLGLLDRGLLLNYNNQLPLLWPAK